MNGEVASSVIDSQSCILFWEALGKEKRGIKLESRSFDDFGRD